jgi:hypothetical protein
MPRNARDTLTLFRLPPESDAWDELKGPITEYRRLAADRKLAQQRLGELENSRRRAVEADRLAYAKALREKTPDPGDKAVKRLDRDMASTRRTIEALEVAIEEAEQELIETVDEHKQDWLKKL